MNRFVGRLSGVVDTKRQVGRARRRRQVRDSRGTERGAWHAQYEQKGGISDLRRGANSRLESTRPRPRRPVRPHALGVIVGSIIWG